MAVKPTKTVPLTVSSITVTIGRTVNTGSYNSVRYDFTKTVTLPPDVRLGGKDDLLACDALVQSVKDSADEVFDQLLGDDE